MKKLVLILAIALVCKSTLVNAQKVGIGGDVMWNFQTESFGAGLRVSIFPLKKLSIVPQFAYYFGFNKVEEYYAGLGLEYKFLMQPKFHLYVIGHGAYNSWLNYQDSDMAGAQKNNWNLEGGLGISTNWCLRPFLEYRYNVKFQETHLRLGVLYIFGCKGSPSGKGGGGGKAKAGFGSRIYGNKRCGNYD